MFVRESDSCCDLAVIVSIRQYDSTTWQNILKPNTKTQSAVTMQENLSTVQIITKNAKNFRKRIFYKIKPLSESETRFSFTVLFGCFKPKRLKFFCKNYLLNVTAKRISFFNAKLPSSIPSKSQSLLPHQDPAFHLISYLM